jgi:hypothetical protein
MTRRSPNLTPEKIAVIVEVIRSWDGRLTWPGLVKKVFERTNAIYTRQALYKHEPIRIAYETHQEKGSAADAGRPAPAALQASTERVRRLEAENAELKKREALLMEQFVRWAYNASTRGITEDFLNQALPPTNRNGNPTSPKRVEATGRRRG